jgi:hypothetical protein
VIDFELLRGRQNETIVKEFCVPGAATSETFRFKSPYKMADHGSSENGLNWADGLIEYKELYTVIRGRGRFRTRVRRLEMYIPRRTADP